jgi:hypothetical protein
VGIFLATRTPGDLDLHCRENVRSWFLGRLPPETLHKLLRPVLQADADLAARLAGHEPGQITLLRGRQSQSFRADRPALVPRPLTDDEILDLAAVSRAHV